MNSYNDVSTKGEGVKEEKGREEIESRVVDGGGSEKKKEEDETRIGGNNRGTCNRKWYSKFEYVVNFGTCGARTVGTNLTRRNPHYVWSCEVLFIFELGFSWQGHIGHGGGNIWIWLWSGILVKVCSPCLGVGV